METFFSFFSRKKCLILLLCLSIRPSVCDSILAGTVTLEENPNFHSWSGDMCTECSLNFVSIIRLGENKKKVLHKLLCNSCLARYFRYREIDESHHLVKWFWEILESFTNDERILFMRFVSGRSRLPTNPADITQRFQILKIDRVGFINVAYPCHSILVPGSSCFLLFNLKNVLYLSKSDFCTIYRRNCDKIGSSLHPSTYLLIFSKAMFFHCNNVFSSYLIISII